MYVIGLPGSDDFTLVDCGLMDMGTYKLNEVDKLGVSPQSVKRIIMTHSHLDHIGCLPEIREALPHAEIWMHSEEARYLERDDETVVYGNRMFESMVRAQYTITKGRFVVPIKKKLEGGEALSLGGLEFKVVHIPGHSAGSIGLFSEDHKLLMSGDTIYADYAIGRYDLVSADPGQLKSSLELIAGMGIDKLLPCHNRIVNSGAEPMIKETVRQWTPMLAS
jgi:glyoxylase-like metal-dependent hydrolase (beta-lactamase superfamily II)